MQVTIFMILLNSLAVAIIGSDILPLASFWVLLLLGIVNLKLAISSYHHQEVFWIITGLSGIIFLLLSFVYAPFSIKCFSLLGFWVIWNCFYRGWLKIEQLRRE